MKMSILLIFQILIDIFELRFRLSIMNIHMQNSQSPVCDICANATRLVAIEPHPELHSTDLRTFECLICNHCQVTAVPVKMNGHDSAAHLALWA